MTRPQIYKCDPEKNIYCAKTACQKECFYTINRDYSLDNKPYVYDDQTQDFIPYEGQTLNGKN